MNENSTRLGYRLASRCVKRSVGLLGMHSQRSPGLQPNGEHVAAVEAQHEVGATDDLRHGRAVPVSLIRYDGCQFVGEGEGKAVHTAYLLAARRRVHRISASTLGFRSPARLAGRTPADDASGRCESLRRG